MIKILIYGFPTSGKTRFIHDYSGPIEVYDTDRLLPLLVPGFSWEVHNHPLVSERVTKAHQDALFSNLRKFVRNARSSMVMLTNYHLPVDIISEFDVCVAAIPETFDVVRRRLLRRGDKDVDFKKWEGWWRDACQYVKHSDHYSSKLFLKSDEYLSDYLDQITG